MVIIFLFFLFLLFLLFLLFFCELPPAVPVNIVLRRQPGICEATNVRIAESSGGLLVYIHSVPAGHQYA